MIPRFAIPLDERPRGMCPYCVGEPYRDLPVKVLARLRMAKRRRRFIWQRGKAGNRPRNAVLVPWGYNA